MSRDEISAMRAWVVQTARSLATVSDMPTPAEIDKLPDDRITWIVDHHYVGGLRLFRYCLKNGLEP